MAKSRIKFICQKCGAIYTKWTGRCNECGAWNSLVENFEESQEGKSAIDRGQASGRVLKYASINELEASDDRERLKTGFRDLDEVLGGGILKVSVLLLAGQPGIGKSTLLMQVCATIANLGKNVLYISGEE